MTIVQLVDQLAQDGCEQGPRDDRAAFVLQICIRVMVFDPFADIAKLFNKSSDHPSPVFDLRIVAVMRRRWNLAAAAKIDLIAEQRKVDPQTRAQFLLNRGYLIDDFATKLW